MKKYLIGLFSVLFLFASIFGATSKGSRDRRSPRSGNRSDWAMWV